MSHYNSNHDWILLMFGVILLILRNILYLYFYSFFIGFSGSIDYLEGHRGNILLFSGFQGSLQYLEDHLGWATCTFQVF